MNNETELILVEDIDRDPPRLYLAERESVERAFSDLVAEDFSPASSNGTKVYKCEQSEIESRLESVKPVREFDPNLTNAYRDEIMVLRIYGLLPPGDRIVYKFMGLPRLFYHPRREGWVLQPRRGNISDS